jgi:hypothetical protein
MKRFWRISSLFCILSLTSCAAAGGRDAGNTDEKTSQRIKSKPSKSSIPTASTRSLDLLEELLKEPLGIDGWAWASARPRNGTSASLRTHSSSGSIGEPLLAPTAWRIDAERFKLLADTAGMTGVGEIQFGERNVKCKFGDLPITESPDTQIAEVLKIMDKAMADQELKKMQLVTLDCSGRIIEASHQMDGVSSKGFATFQDVALLLDTLDNAATEVAVTDGRTVELKVDSLLLKMLGTNYSESNARRLKQELFPVMPAPGPRLVGFEARPEGGVDIISIYRNEDAAKLAQKVPIPAMDYFSRESTFAGASANQSGRVVRFTVPGIKMERVPQLAVRGSFPMFIVG